MHCLSDDDSFELPTYKIKEPLFTLPFFARGGSGFC